MSEEWLRERQMNAEIAANIKKKKDQEERADQKIIIEGIKEGVYDPESRIAFLQNKLKSFGFERLRHGEQISAIKAEINSLKIIAELEREMISQELPDSKISEIKKKIDTLMFNMKSIDQRIKSLKSSYHYRDKDDRREQLIELFLFISYLQEFEKKFEDKIMKFPESRKASFKEILSSLTYGITTTAVSAASIIPNTFISIAGLSATPLELSFSGLSHGVDTTSNAASNREVNKFSSYNLEDPLSSEGGKTKRHYKKSRTKRNKKSITKRNKKSKKNNKRTKRRRNLKGGTCYGSGVGANNYDPNFSIYNTRELQLFPYKPNQ